MRTPSAAIRRSIHPSRSICFSILLVLTLSLLLKHASCHGHYFNFDYFQVQAISERDSHGILSPSSTIPTTVTNETCLKEESSKETVVVCNGQSFYPAEDKDVPGSAQFFLDLILCIVLVLIAGLMSGLTLGLLGMDTTTLEILTKEGDADEQLYANRILPIVRKHHLLLVTLLLANAAAMEALPIFLEHLVPGWAAIVISVTAVLFFGEIIPQAILSKWSLLIGGKIWWLVWGLMAILFPLAWPISKILDFILGHKSGVYYKRAQLKEFVSHHAAAAFENALNAAEGSSAAVGDLEEGGKGSSDSSSDSDDGGLPKEERLTYDEVLIIKGALDLTSKIVEQCMTPLDRVFSLNERININTETLQTILDSGHSRIPVWRDDPSNFVGMILVKQLNLRYILEGGSVTKAILKELPLVPNDTPLYTMLNNFQTGHSHMAAVLAPGSLHAIGIITLEDIIEELIQEEIEDEMDLWRKDHIRMRKQSKSPSISRRNSLARELPVRGINRSKSSQVMTKKERREQRLRTRHVREHEYGQNSGDESVTRQVSLDEVRAPSDLYSGAMSDIELETRRVSMSDMHTDKAATDTELTMLEH